MSPFGPKSIFTWVYIHTWSLVILGAFKTVAGLGKAQDRSDGEGWD